MHTKKHLKPRGITILLIKSTGIMRFVPLIAIDLAALGLILLSAFGRMDSDSILSDLLLISQIFFPLFSVWWVIFILWGLIDADGSELIFTVCRKSLLRYIFPPFLIMLANVSAITAVCAVILPAFAVEFLRILSACVLYFGIAYFACVVTKLTSVSLFLLILYTLASAICRSHEIVFPFYMSQTLIDGETAVKLCLPLFAAGILLCAAGRMAEKRLRTNIR